MYKHKNRVINCDQFLDNPRVSIYACSAVIWKIAFTKRQELTKVKLSKLSFQLTLNSLNVVQFLLGSSPASVCYWPTFRNALSVPSS
jgi:hypothetical protein